LRTAGDAGVIPPPAVLGNVAAGGAEGSACVDATAAAVTGLTSTAWASASSAANVTITSPTLTTCCSVTCTWATTPV
jgi:hypothetical protein